MNELTAELHALVTELIAAGVPATVDPGLVLSVVTKAGVCALVEPAEAMGLGLASIDLAVPVRLITAGSYNLAAVERLDDALLRAFPVIGPQERVTRARWDAADADMPALRLTASRRIKLPPATARS